LRLSDRSPFALAAYGLAALLALLELSILWLAVHPQVSEEYAAYFITRTTTCLVQPVTGAYQLGKTLNFRSEGDDTRELRPCGWTGPSGDGLDSIGEESRLRFAIAQPQDLVLTLEMTGVELRNADARKIVALAGDEPVGEATIPAGTTETVSFPIPASAIKDGYLDILLKFPNAVRPSDTIANTYWRSVKLLTGQLAPAP
jgi:hypothetical protein